MAKEGGRCQQDVCAVSRRLRVEHCLKGRLCPGPQDHSFVLLAPRRCLPPPCRDFPPHPLQLPPLRPSLSVSFLAHVSQPATRGPALILAGSDDLLAPAPFRLFRSLSRVQVCSHPPGPLFPWKTVEHKLLHERLDISRCAVSAEMCFMPVTLTCSTCVFSSCAIFRT